MASLPVVSALESGPTVWRPCVAFLSSAGGSETLQVLSAQKIARLARGFHAIHGKEEREAFQRAIQDIFVIHLPPHGLSAVWRQLCMAVVSVQLWLGEWTPIGLQSLQLPMAVLKELLALPAYLLFDDGALPLDSVRLWRQGAQTMVNSCEQVFGALLGPLSSGESLQVVAGWLKGARVALEWLEETETSPALKALEDQKVKLLMLAQAFPEEACEVAQQLARWPLYDAQVWPLLRPLLDLLLPLSARQPRLVPLLPVLVDLAADRWPRACLEVPDALNLQDLAVATLSHIGFSFSPHELLSTFLRESAGSLLWWYHAVTTCHSAAISVTRPVLDLPSA
ncbi:unnamed protein product [Durusdinium trenchii]|uniref:Uncharacterized protein n=1 Tax=Durusdinium trenchii TaxID=1381693 RepID=A0ABP0J4G8_9DINO